ncbi:hypothetical protein LTR08_002814 [Meristemomyces frigidus]|nr:hypothetical protein LTR08_002814 [Meristemomyces frigidus]
MKRTPWFLNVVPVAAVSDKSEQPEHTTAASGGSGPSERQRDMAIVLATAVEASLPMRDHFFPGISFEDWHRRRTRDTASNVNARLHHQRRSAVPPPPTRRRHAPERVFRARVPRNPNASPLVGLHEATHVESAHNHSRAKIARLVRKQLAQTKAVFALRRSNLGGLGRGLRVRLGGYGFGDEMRRHTILGLRGKGVEVVEYWARPQRVEVRFQFEEEQGLV